MTMTMTPAEIQQAATTALQLVNQKIALQNIHRVLMKLSGDAAFVAELENRATDLQRSVTDLERQKARANEDARVSRSAAFDSVATELRGLQDAVQSERATLSGLQQQAADLAAANAAAEQHLAELRAAIGRVTSAAAV